MTTTRDLINEHNALARELGQPEIAGWKASKEALRDRIEALRNGHPDALDAAEEPSAAEPDEQAPDAAEVAGGPAEQPQVIHTVDLIPHGVTAEVEHYHKGKGKIGLLVKELLLDPAGYDYGFIVDAVRRQHPTANTTRRSVASVAAALRRDGVNVPKRAKNLAAAPHPA